MIFILRSCKLDEDEERLMDLTLITKILRRRAFFDEISMISFKGY